MSSTRRRLELAFAFIDDMIEEPSRLAKLSEYAAFGLSIEDDPVMTAESVEMLRQADLPKGAPRGVLIRGREPDPEEASATKPRLMYRSVEPRTLP